MYCFKKDKVGKFSLVTSFVMFLSISSVGLTNVNALDLSNYGLDNNVEQDTDCVIVVVGCDGTGSVGSSGETVIGSGNGNGDNNSNGGGGAETRPGTLKVSKEIVCKSTNGTPSDEEVCDFARSSLNYPQLGNFEFTVSGNNPNPSTSFPASTSGTPVIIGPGDYTINEGFPGNFDIDFIRSELNALSATLDGTSVKGDCDFINHVTATGSMTTGGAEHCTFINTITFSFGTVPGPNT